MKKTSLNQLIKKLFITSLIINPTLFMAESKAAESMSVLELQQRLNRFEFLPVEIRKSPNDKAQYQAIRLANQMEVLLISDAAANKSLMALALPIGSMEDPEKQQGLAHYLEHMILMGSEKYPETNSLDHFLNQNGGSNNASTTADRTAYYLSVNNEAFDEAVDRLADAFAAPLLSEANAKKEVNAVHAEMIRAKSSDGHLLHSVNLATSNPAHPMTKFAVGNLTTLSDKADNLLQTELEQFYQRYYSANLVKAVLYSNQPIEKMATLAEKTLGRMSNHNLQAPSVNMPLYRDEDKGVWIDYKPVKPNKMLAINFDLPNDEQHFSAKSGEFLAYIFNNHTENTLSDYLIKNGLSDSGISAVPSANVSRNRGAFTFYVALTDKGVAQKEQIISLIFQQIELVKKQGILPAYFAEMKASLAQEFQHLQTEKNGRYAEYLAEQMLYYPIEHILDEPYYTESLDEQAVSQKLAAMTLENARILYVNDNVHTDRKTPYFEADYAVRPLTLEEKEKWQNFAQNPPLALPKPNPYMATDFSVIEAIERKKPKQIVQGKGSAIYAMPSDYFASDPKARISVNFAITQRDDALKTYLTATLLNYMNALAQAQLDFQASVAGMETALTVGANGLSLQAEGYTQHLQTLLADNLTLFKTFPLNEAMLNQAKERYLESLERAEKESSATQAGAALTHFASFPYFEEVAQKSVLATITLADIQAQRERLLTQIDSFKLLSVGNYSDEQIQALHQRLTQLIPNQDKQLNTGRYLNVEGSERKLNFIKNVPHQDHALSFVFLANGYEELAGEMNARLLADIVSRWYFNDLRTEQQLGYVVYATTHKIGTTSGLRFLVQSPNHTPTQIMQHNQRFWAETAQKLANLSEQEFSQYKSSLLEKLKYKPESLGQEFATYSRDYARNNAKFDRLDLMIETLEKLTKADVVKFYHQAVIEQKGLTLISQALAANSQANSEVQLPNFERIESIEAIQREFKIKER